MSELLNDPAVRKIIEYGKSKKKITYDELNDYLPDYIVNSDKIEDVIALLEKNNIAFEEEEVQQQPQEEEEEEEDFEEEDVVDADEDADEEDEEADPSMDEDDEDEDPDSDADRL